jgi:hypothetical protein
MSTYIFDIETGPRSRAELAECVPHFDAPANWKDPEKIRAYVAEKEAEWFQSGALSALTGRVLAIGYTNEATGEIGFFASNNEAADIAAFWQLIAPTGYLQAELIGFNSNRFDLPFLIRRSWHLRVSVPTELVSGRFLPSQCRDLLDCWRCGNREDSVSLDRLAQFLGVGRKTGHGADFASQWATDPAGALDYLANDLRLTRRCAVALGLLAQPSASQPSR